MAESWHSTESVCASFSLDVGASCTASIAVSCRHVAVKTSVPKEPRREMYSSAHCRCNGPEEPSAKLVRRLATGGPYLARRCWKVSEKDKGSLQLWLDDALGEPDGGPSRSLSDMGRSNFLSTLSTTLTRSASPIPKIPSAESGKSLFTEDVFECKSFPPAVCGRVFFAFSIGRSDGRLHTFAGCRACGISITGGQLPDLLKGQAVTSKATIFASALRNSAHLTSDLGFLCASSFRAEAAGRISVRHPHSNIASSTKAA